MVTTLREIFWNTSMTKRPPSSGGMGSRFIMPSDTEMEATNEMALANPRSTACFDMAAIPMTDVEFCTTSPAVDGLNSPAISCTTMPMYMKPIWIASSGLTLTCRMSPALV